MAHVAELDDRIAKCNRILEENPNSQIFAALAEAYRKKGELDKAFRACQAGLRVHPNYGSAHVVMAKINFDKGFYDWAELEALKAVELEGSSHTTDLLLAEIHIYKGEFARSTKILNKLHAADPSNSQVIKLLEIARKLPMESVPSPGPTAKPPEEAARERSTVATEPRKIGFKEFLDNLAAVSGVDAVLIINRDGLVADSRWDEALPADTFGAVAIEIQRTVQAQIELSHFGKCESILLEAGELIMNFLPLKGNFLLIKANRQINLGTLRLKLSSLLSRLSDEIN